MAGGGSGKILAGCSGCLVLISLFLTVALAFGAGQIYTLSDGKIPVHFVAYGQYASSLCCCLSGVGMVAGIAMLLMGGKDTDE